MTMPNFLIIGAAKSGTTSLYHYLRQHPQVFMSDNKEPWFFAFEESNIDFTGPNASYFVGNSITTLGAYRRLFDAVDGQSAVGEASVVYLYSERACERIRHHLPDVRIIAVLRHPADRAYSHFLHNVRTKGETVFDFKTALREEPRRMQEGWGFPYYYRDCGFYYRQLAGYFRHFPRDHIAIWLYDDIEADINSVLNGLMRFLGIEDQKLDTSQRHQVSRNLAIPRSSVVDAFVKEENSIKRIARRVIPASVRNRVRGAIENLNVKKPEFLDSIRRELIDGYRDDLLRLQDLLHRNLSHWLE